METVFTENDYNRFITPVSVHEPEGIIQLKKLSIIPEDVRTKAIEIYYELEEKMLNIKSMLGANKKPKGMKQNKRLRRLFVCIFRAYNELGHPVDQCYLAEKLGLPKSKIDTAFSENQSYMIINPILLTRFYAKQLEEAVPSIQIDIDQLLEEIQRIYDMCIKSEKGQSTIENNSAKTIAVGLLYFYLQTKDMDHLFKPFVEKAWDLSLTCIRRYADIISTLFNESPNTIVREPRVWYEV